ncbi:PEP/pyruvate-binding domain-containing protein [Desulforamulus aeronauticus]|uniref:Pyruvate, water dikinase n=1 Tax=Desulforamulus aeronauticus DSM 10349 TaxID=1121421 RepID=A0A1M6QC83_9FIRM|nr:PEP/pyruvate-binding domain-containing protein [Desulforamulus aeronauticus]SHK17778.1 pyruvate, water dikinase [Desulforamulus aeronauticus DSM 10349]
MEKSCGSFFFSWSEAFNAGAGGAGGKGWNLGRLARYGFTIPQGGVVSAEAYHRFIQGNNLSEVLETISRDVTIANVLEKETEEKLFLLREKIKVGRILPPIQEELICKLKNMGIFEKPLAVRSSATAEDTSGATFAGIHESFLNVQGIENVLSAIKDCYASLWTPRAVAYRRKMNIRDDEVIPAVVIMEMVEAMAAGVGFTCDPRTGREDVLVINANFGLGESVVSGAVEPDEYILDPMIGIKKRIGRKQGKTMAKKTGGTEFVDSAGASAGQVLTDEMIGKLGLLLQRVYEVLGDGEQHQDIEWVFDGKEFILVQARPVTVLPRYTFEGIKNQPDIWSNANFRDGIPMVQSTLNWSVTKKSLNMLLDAPLKAIGYPIPSGIQHVRLYQGRAYFNLSIQQWQIYDSFGFPPKLVNQAYGGHQPEIDINEKKSFFGIKESKRLKYLLKAMFVGQKIRKSATKSFDRIKDFAETLLKEDLTCLTEKDLLKKHSDIENLFIEFVPVFMFCSSAPVYPPEKILGKYFPGKGKAVANALMAGGGDITSAQHGYRLIELAEIAREDIAARRFFSSQTFEPLLWERELPEESVFKQSLRNFLAEYGHRGVYEMDIINPRWREDPSYLLNIIKSTMETADLHKVKKKQQARADEAWQEVRQRLPLHQRILVKNLVNKALQAAGLREMAKFVLAHIFESERIIFQEIGRRLADRKILSEPSDIFHCTLNEVISILQGAWDGRNLAIIVTERQAKRNEMELLLPPDLIIGESPQFVETVTYNSEKELTGLGVAAGKASGEAKLIFHPNEGEKLLVGDVLVAPSTDPGWTPLFLKASAIVMETGGFLSHGSIVAREYGIPAVVNIPGVMKILKGSQLITVDGDAGKIYL